VVYLRNCNHSRRVVIRTAGAPAGRLILPGATTALAIDRTVLEDPRIQRRLAEVRVAVLGRAGWCADLRQRRAAELDWAELIAQAERAEIDRLRTHLQRVERPGGLPRERAVQHLRQLLRQRWKRGVTQVAIAAELGVTAAAVGMRFKRMGLGARPHPGEWPAERTERLRQLWSQGVRLREIAAELGVNHAAVTEKVKRLMLPAREKPRMHNEWPAEWVEQLRTRRAEGASWGSIAVELGTTRDAAISRARRLSLEPCHRLHDTPRPPATLRAAEAA
jgi:hypothetical protein